MNNKETVRFLSITIVMGILIFCSLVYFLNKGDVYNVKSLRYVAITTSLVSGFWALYFWLLWKLPVLKYIMFRPNISGVWIGYANSDYIHDGKKVPSFKIALIIKQSFLNTKVVGCSNTFHSTSYVESFRIKEEKYKRSLVYLYQSVRSSSKKVDGRSGASELLVFLGNKKEMSGEYWTQAGSTGYINVFWKKKGLLEKIETFKDVTNKWSTDSEWKK